MKNLIFFLSLIPLFACSKDDDAPQSTTYQIINDMPIFENDYDYLDGTVWEIVVYCYIGSDIVRQDNIDSIAPLGGKSRLIDVGDNYEKVKVSFKLLPEKSIYYHMAERYYIISFLEIKQGENNIMKINDDTMSSNVLKKITGFGKKNDSLASPHSLPD